MQKFSAAQLGIGMQLNFADLSKTSLGNAGSVLGFEFLLDSKNEYKSFLWSFNFSANFPLSEPKFDRPIDNAQFSEVNLRSTYDFSRWGIGLSYYPIQGWENAVLNPFAHVYAGAAIHQFEIYHSQHPFGELSLSYAEMRPNNRMSAFTGRLGLGLDFSLSNLRKKGDDSDFSIRLAVNYNYISRMNFIDIHNTSGDNPVLGLVRDVQNQTTHVVQIGNLHRVAPRYWTFEIGFIWRIFDFGDEPAVHRTRQNEYEY
jgi:hypothetical protein